MPTDILHIEDSPLSVRAKNALTTAGFSSVDQCLSLTDVQLFAIRNLGKKTVHEILSYLKEFKPSNGVYGDSSVDVKETEARLQYLKSVLALPISEILFSVRVKNVLEKLGVNYLKDLVLLARAKILKQKNAGVRSLKEIVQFLNQLDLALDMFLSPSLLSEIQKHIQTTSENSQKLIQDFRSLYPDKAIVLGEIRIRTIRPERMEFYKRCFELYNQGGTLEYVAGVMKLTRERIRQILIKGTKYGLFEYKGREYPYISKAKLLADLSQNPRIDEVAKINNVSPGYTNRLLVSYHISTKHIESFRLQIRKRKAIDEYRSIKNKIGHDPTTTELQAESKWRALWARISRYWGTFTKFRQEMNIPPPPPFVEAIRPWIEHRSRLALIRRMQDLDSVRDCLMTSGSLRATEVARQCQMNPMRAFKLIQMLIATGEAAREGIGSQTKYKAIRAGGNK